MGRKSYAALAFALLLAGGARGAAATTITLAGFDLYTSDAAGANASGGYRYSSNSSDTSAFAQKLTFTAPGSGSQSTGIAFQLAEGDNTFTFAPDPDVHNGHGDHPNTFLAGIDLFFTGDGTSYNPATTDTPGIAGNLVVVAPATSASSFLYPIAGTSVQDYQNQGSRPTSYSGATSFTIGDRKVSVSAVSIDGTPSGSITLTVMAVPEPASAAVLALGTTGLLARRRRGHVEVAD